MFDKLRETLRHLADGTLPPEDRRAAVARMKTTLVQARLGLDDLRAGLAKVRAQLAAEERELETVRRRKTLAQGINDAETVAVAARYERQHAERVALLVRKVDTQAEELAMMEREVGEMTVELSAAARGGGAIGTAGAGPRTVPDPLEAEGEALRQDLDAMARARARDANEQSAADKLAELKRRMGR